MQLQISAGATACMHATAAMLIGVAGTRDLAKSFDSPSVSMSTDEALIFPSLSAPEQVITRRLASVTLCISTSPPEQHTASASVTCASQALEGIAVGCCWSWTNVCAAFRERYPCSDAQQHIIAANLLN